jgi:hypothetical protein
VRSLLWLVTRQIAALQHCLYEHERRCVDQSFVPALILDTTEDDPPKVVAVMQNLVQLF